jgi:hypothetical protein
MSAVADAPLYPHVCMGCGHQGDYPLGAGCPHCFDFPFHLRMALAACLEPVLTAQTEEPAENIPELMPAIMPTLPPVGYQVVAHCQTCSWATGSRMHRFCPYGHGPLASGSSAPIGKIKLPDLGAPSENPSSRGDEVEPAQLTLWRAA